MDKTCIYCKKTKPINYFVKYKLGFRNECKECKAIQERIRRQTRTKEQSQIINRKNYLRQKELLISRSQTELINFWCARQLKRKEFDRSKISKDFLIDQCKLAKRRFKYLAFDLSRTTHRALLASIDRIDPTKGYTEDNIQVVPLWLNSAKLDLPIDFLHKLMES